jgi:hypothetical protein
MPKEEYLDALTTKMQSWRERLGSDQNSEVGEKYEQVVDLLTSYERMGAGAWREEERALNEACSELELAIRRS